MSCLIFIAVTVAEITGDHRKYARRDVFSFPPLHPKVVVHGIVCVVMCAPYITTHMTSSHTLEHCRKVSV